MIVFYYSFGEYDGMVLAEMPDKISGLATNMAAFAEGNLSKLKTTNLITVEEAMQAMKIASGVKLPQPQG